MAVYFAPQRNPWWSGPLAQLLTGQIDAMMQRTSKAKDIERQRAFNSAMAGFYKNSPDAGPMDILTAAMETPGYESFGGNENPALKQMIEERKRQIAERDLFSQIGGDQAGILRTLYNAGKAGMNPDTVGKYAYPEGKGETLDLGNRKISFLRNPHTGAMMGDPASYDMGIDPGTQAQIDQRGWEKFQGADGKWYWGHPTLGIKGVGVTGAVPTDKRGPAMKFSDMGMEALGKAYNDAVAAGDLARARAIRTTMVNNDPAAFMPPGAYEKAIREGDSPEAIKAWILKELQRDDF
ncbi:MAG: hypothetical protein EOM68_10725 [Spirochaetia bacterium]|nr:hypothetical protein [Spirochaetia bacterium]